MSSAGLAGRCKGTWWLFHRVLCVNNENDFVATACIQHLAEATLKLPEPDASTYDLLDFPWEKESLVRTGPPEVLLRADAALGTRLFEP